ncbi:hypothetical protein LC612_29860 [Nostoc sp. CHAB 5834]|nr:hypothetical protein [Nostoc sp. CHAB 5834]
MPDRRDVAVVVISCDKFSSLWDLFFERFSRFWPDFEGQMYLISNHKDFEREGVKTICVGDDRDWSSNLEIALSRIPEDNLLLMLEDAPLDRGVDHSNLTKIFADFCEQHFDYLNLKASPRPKNVPANSTYGQYPANLMYRTALVPCLWRKTVLQDLLVPGESAWQFEIRGSRRSNKFESFYSVRDPVLHFLHCVIQGKLDRRAAAKLNSTGEIEALNFPVMSKHEYRKLRLKEFRGSLFAQTPSWVANAIRKFYFKHVKKDAGWV